MQNLQEPVEKYWSGAMMDQKTQYSNTPLLQLSSYLNISLNFLLHVSNSSLLGNLITTI